MRCASCKEIKAFVSALVAKDRLLAHNPLVAIYSGYWRNKRLGLKDDT